MSTTRRHIQTGVSLAIVLKGCDAGRGLWKTVRSALGTKK